MKKYYLFRSDVLEEEGYIDWLKRALKKHSESDEEIEETTRIEEAYYIIIPNGSGVRTDRELLSYGILETDGEVSRRLPVMFGWTREALERLKKWRKEDD